MPPLTEADLMAAGAFLTILAFVVMATSLAFGRRREPEDVTRVSEFLWRPGTLNGGSGNGNGHGNGNGNGHEHRDPAPPGFWGGVVYSFAYLVPQLPFDRRQLKQELLRAGQYHATARLEYLAVRNALVMLILLATGVLTVFADPSDPNLAGQVLLGGLLLAALTFSLPRLYIQSVGDSRVYRIEKGLSEAFDLIAMCMVGGLSLQLSLERVARDMKPTNPELAFELEIVRHHTEYSSLEQAFRHFANRINLPELRSISSIIAQSDRLGTGMVAPLGEAADDLRRSFRVRADGRANSAVIRLFLPIFLLILPSTFLMLWGPAMLELRSAWRKEAETGGAFDLPDTRDIKFPDMDDRPRPEE